MSVNIDNDVVDVIGCVAFFYEKGKSENSFLRKEKFRAQLPRKEKTLKSVRETVRQVLFLSFTNLDFWNYYIANEDKELRELR